jgi:hypothetical protein
MKILRVVRQTGQTTPLRCVATFLGAHEVPAEFIGRAGAYVDLVIEEMLPLVSLRKLAGFCDVFCMPHIFDQQSAGRILEAARGLGFGRGSTRINSVVPAAPSWRRGCGQLPPTIWNIPTQTRSPHLPERTSNLSCCPVRYIRLVPNTTHRRAL